MSTSYIIASKVNQDLLENAFSHIRGFGGFNANPTAVEFIYRIRKLILAWNFMDSRNAPVPMENDDSDTTHPIFSQGKQTSNDTDIDSTVCFSEELLSNLSRIGSDIRAVILDLNNYGVEGRCEEGGIEYVSDRIAAKFRETHPEYNTGGALESPNNFWISKISRGGLTEHSVFWLSLFHKFEQFFNVVHRYGSVNMESRVCEKLQNYLQAKFNDVPRSIIKYYVSTRTHLRVKFLNKKAEDGEFQRQEARHQMGTNIPKDSRSGMMISRRRTTFATQSFPRKLR